MNIRKKNKNEGVESSALNDILFILLFFFLIVATMANPNVIKLTNPQADSNDRAKQTVVVSIDAEQQFYINTKAIDEGMLQTAMQEALSKEAEADPTVVINADKEATADNIVAVMRAAHALNIKAVLAVASK